MVLMVRPADEVKLSAIEYFIAQYPGVLIGSEVMYGTDRRVVDLLALYEGESYAIEIKSEKDSTRRLDEQLKAYAHVFDYTLVFTHPKHLSAVLPIAKSRASIYEVLGNEKVKRTPLRRNRPTKHEMVHSMSLAFLRSRFSADVQEDLRMRLVRMCKWETIHQSFYDFLKQRLAARFALYMQERSDGSYDELSLLSAQLNVYPF